MRLPAALIFICAAAFSQQPSATAPQIISKTDPQLPEEARLAKLSGSVHISLIVGEDGEPRNIRALTSPGLGLDQQAIAAVSKWRFKPGLKDGTPVPVSVQVEVNFRLLTDRGAWAPTRIAFDSPDGTARPILTAAPYPDMYSPTGETGSVTLSFDVDTTGAPANLHIIRSSGMAAESEVTRIVRGWQFQPALKNSQPVPVRCTMEFSKGSQPLTRRLELLHTASKKLQRLFRPRAIDNPERLPPLLVIGNKESFHLIEKRLADILHTPDILMIVRMNSHARKPVVPLRLSALSLLRLNNPDNPNLHQTSNMRRRIHQHHHVERVTVIAERRRDKAKIEWKHHSFRKEAAKHEQV